MADSKAEAKTSPRPTTHPTKTSADADVEVEDPAVANGPVGDPRYDNRTAAELAPPARSDVKPQQIPGPDAETQREHTRAVLAARAAGKES